MVSRRHPTPKEIQKAFDEVLDHLHLGIPTDAGFDTQTYLALTACSLQPDNESLRSRARNELRKQLAGRPDDDEGWEQALRDAREN